LDEFQPHLVISDFSMPQFSGPKALAIARESRGDIPFIFISGTIGENVAVDMMKAGADDYVMKNNLARLVPALKRELREAEVRRSRRLAEERLHESEAGLHRAGGGWSRVRQVIEPLQSQADAEGATRWFSTLQDVTEHRLAEEKILRLTRVHAVLSGINALIVRVRDRDELFREACRIAVEAGKFKLAWLGVVDREAMRVKPVAWHGGEQDYFR